MYRQLNAMKLVCSNDLDMQLTRFVAQEQILQVREILLSEGA